MQVVFGDDYFNGMPIPGRNHIVEGFGHGRIGCNSAHKIDRLLKNSFFQRGDHPGNALTERIEHGVQRGSLLLEVDKVSLGKDAAPGSYPGGSAFALQGQAGEVLHADANPICLLLKKSSCARSTKWV